MRERYLGLTCVVVACITLSLGLWPFHAPKNDVTWLRNRPGLRFGKFGTVISSGILTSNEAAQSIEIWLHPTRVWDSGTFLSFSDPSGPLRFALRQSQADLVLKGEFLSEGKSVRLKLGDVFRKNRPVFLSIVSGEYGTSVYVDGVLVKAAPGIHLPPHLLSGRLVVGGSSGQGDSWSGQLFGLAVYGQGLAASQVSQHYREWMENKQPAVVAAERLRALYLFDRHTGSIIPNHIANGVGLLVPERYFVLNKLFLEPFWEEFRKDQGYWGAAGKNIVGLIPFGFCFYSYLSMVCGVRRAKLATVLLGTLTSFTIEVLQFYLPTRESGTSDLFTNTLGTYLGVVLYQLAGPALATVPWSPFSAEPPRPIERKT